jgi:hypothetical protein
MDDEDEQFEDEQLEIFSITQIQAIARKWAVRTKLVKKLQARYEKIYDPRKKKYYYYDKELDRSAWKKPRLLLDKDVSQVSPTYTDDAAAVLIQTRARMKNASLRVRLDYQASLFVGSDAESGAPYYYNSMTDNTMWELPPFMNGHLTHSRKEVVVPVVESAKASTEGEEDGEEDDGEGDGEGEGDGDLDNDDDDDSEAGRQRKRMRRRYPR